MPKPNYVKELNLTPEEAAAVLRYREWVQKRRMEGRLAPLRAEVAAQYPELSEETREELVDTLYRRQMAEFSLKGRG